MGLTNLYNRDSNQQISQLPVGGMPIFLDDLQNMEQNTLSYGVSSLLNGWSCIISGCLVDNLDVSSKTLDLTSGYFMIDNIVYYTHGFTGQTYPFSFIPGAVTSEDRIFKDGNTKTIGSNYDYAITTSFSNYQNGYPQEVYDNPKQIYYDPFTAQKSEYILRNLSNGYLETRNSRQPFTIGNTETGNNITGGLLNQTALGKWQWFGYVTNTFDNSYTRNAGGSDPSSGGSNIISNSNLPRHIHGAGTLLAANAGVHGHQFKNATATIDNATIAPFGNVTNYLTSALGQNLSSPAIPVTAHVGETNNAYTYTGHPVAFLDEVNQDGSHTHPISGSTDDGGFSNSNFTPKFQSYRIWSWGGYNPLNQNIEIGISLPVFCVKPPKYNNM